MGRFHRVTPFVVLACEVLASCQVFDGSERRARTTARAFAAALYTKDSLALARLAASASAHNSLCAARSWPAALMGSGASVGEVRTIEPLPSDTIWFFRVYGERLAGDTDRAGYLIVIGHRDPEHVQAFAIISGANPGDSAFSACIERGNQ